MRLACDEVEDRSGQSVDHRVPDGPHAFACRVILPRPRAARPVCRARDRFGSHRSLPRSAQPNRCHTASASPCLLCEIGGRVGPAGSLTQQLALHRPQRGNGLRASDSWLRRCNNASGVHAIGSIRARRVTPCAAVCGASCPVGQRHARISSSGHLRGDPPMAMGGRFLETCTRQGLPSRRSSALAPGAPRRGRIRATPPGAPRRTA